MEKKQSFFPLLSAFLLTFVGGFIEAYSVLRYGIFAGMQTGNLINFFANIIDASFADAWYRLAVVVFFFAGCLLSEAVRSFFKRRGRSGSVPILALQLVFLLPLLFWFVPEGPLFTTDILPDMFLSVFAALQYTSFKSVDGIGYSTTMMTNMLTQIAHDVTALPDEREKGGKKRLLVHLGVFLSFLVGATLFALLYRFVPLQETYQCLLLLVPFALVASLLLLTILDERRERMEHRPDVR